MSDFATIDDVTVLWRALSDTETDRAQALLPVISDLLRQEAAKAGKDLDEMVAENRALVSTAKAVTVDVLARVLRQSTTGEVLSQESQTALGYTWQGTYAIPGGGIAGAIMKNDLKRLGILRQRMGVIDFYASRDNNPTAAENADGC